MMLYKPKFCCQCGEKIDGVDRKFWTSRRFCELCATEVGIYDRIPQIFGGILVTLGLFGIGTYIQKPERSLPIAPNQIVASNVKSDGMLPKTVARVSTNNTVQQTTRAGVSVFQVNAPPVPPKSDLKIEKAAAPPEPAEKVYFCGAPTKKGAMCSRRMKNGGRCWQHEGQAALLSQEKLLAIR